MAKNMAAQILGRLGGQKQTAAQKRAARRNVKLATAARQAQRKAVR
jgi:hypothetical protein